MKDLMGKETMVVVSTRTPLVFAKANGTQGVSMVFSAEDAAEGEHALTLLGKKTAICTEVEPSLDGKTARQVERERDADPECPIAIPYENIAGWTVVPVEEGEST